MQLTIEELALVRKLIYAPVDPGGSWPVIMVTALVCLILFSKW